MGEPFNCGLCRRDERLDKSWLHHISSLGHQRALTRLPSGGQGDWEKTSESRDRAIQMVGCQELKASPMEIVEFLVKYGGPVQEFICPTSLAGTKPEIIYCLFKNAQSVGRILELEEPRLYRQPLRIQRRFSWDDDEIPDGAREIVTEVPDDARTSNENGNIQMNGVIAAQPKPSCTNRMWKGKRKPPKLVVQLSALCESHDLSQRTKFCKELDELLRNTFSNCVVSTCGTDFLGIHLDTDCSRFCIDPYGKLATKNLGVITTSKSDPLSINLLLQILSTLKHSDGSPQFKFVSTYSVSRTENIPEISFKFYDTVPAIVRFENFVSVQKAKCIKFLISHDVRVYPLFSLLRHWSAKNNVLFELREGEEFEGYILVLLMIFFLSRSKIIPCIMKLRYMCQNYPLVIDDRDMAFCSDRKQIPSNREKHLDDSCIRFMSVLGVLKDFFKFFAEFKFQHNVICPSIGKTLERKCFRPQMEKYLPPEISKMYRYRADGSLNEEKLNIFSPIVLQDIFDLTENVAQAVEEVDVCLFQKKCHEGVILLLKTLKEGSGDLTPLFGRQLSEEEWFNESTSDDEMSLAPPPPEKSPRLSSTTSSLTSPTNSSSAEGNKSPLASMHRKPEASDVKRPNEPSGPERILRDPKHSQVSSPMMISTSDNRFRPKLEAFRNNRRDHRRSIDLSDSDEQKSKEVDNGEGVLSKAQDREVCRIPIYPRGQLETKSLHQENDWTRKSNDS